MHTAMTFSAECDQILAAIITGVTAKGFVVNLKIVQSPGQVGPYDCDLNGARKVRGGNEPEMSRLRIP